MLPVHKPLHIELKINVQMLSTDTRILGRKTIQSQKENIHGKQEEPFYIQASFWRMEERGGGPQGSNPSPILR